jgi:hypothetical protein
MNDTVETGDDQASSNAGLISEPRTGTDVPVMDEAKTPLTI